MLHHFTNSMIGHGKSIKNHFKNSSSYSPPGNYMFRVNNRNTRTRCEICSKLTIKTPQRPQWGRSSVFIVRFEHISHLFLVLLLLTLSK